MKKLISLLLVIIMLCSMMTSCDNALMLEAVPHFYSTVDESLTDRDIEFLSTDPRNYKDPGHWWVQLSDIVELTKMRCENGQEEAPLMWVQNSFDSAYYLCLYTYDDSFKPWLEMFDNWFNTDMSAKYYKWYRFDYCEFKDIPREIDGKELIDVLFLCDSVIKKDLISGESYNINFTFYLNVGTNIDKYTETQLIYNKVWKDMLCYRQEMIIDELLDDSKYLFMTICLYDKTSRYVNDFPLYTDENGVVYLYFLSDDGYYLDGEAITHDHVIKRNLLDYYDILLPYFERLEELEPESQKYQVIGIKLDIIEELVFNNMD